ncbi:hypothetical protein SVIOM74S_04801 [Streptomyces violarus]
MPSRRTRSPSWAPTASTRDSFFPVLEGARIPYIGGYGLTNTEFTSPLSYPVNGGQPALLAGLGSALADACGPVTLVRPDTIAGDQLPGLLDSGLVSGGHERSHDQRAAEDATAYDDQSGQALAREGTGRRKPGCVVPVLGDRTGTFMDSFRRAREDHPGVRTATVLGSVDQTTVNASGGASGPYEGAYVTGWYPSVGDPAWDGLKKLIKEQAFGDNDIDAADAGVQTTWIAYTVFEPGRRVARRRRGERRYRTAGARRRSGGPHGRAHSRPLRWTFADKLASVGFPRLVERRRHAPGRCGRAGWSRPARAPRTPPAPCRTPTWPRGAARPGQRTVLGASARSAQPGSAEALGQAVLLGDGVPERRRPWPSPCSPCRSPGWPLQGCVAALPFLQPFFPAVRSAQAA